jgi:hypothetical protein
MAKYRSIHEKIWKDPDFQAYIPEGKLLFIYLCTNGSTSESGIYAITPKTIADETGIKQESIIKVMKNLKNVMWDEKLNFVYIRRFRLYNGGGAPENVKKAIVAEFLQSCNLSFWLKFVEDYPEYREPILATGKPLTPSLIPPTPPITNSNSNSNSIDRLENLSPTDAHPLENKAKKPYGEFKNVLLSDNEVLKLKNRFNNQFQDKIESLSEWLESKGEKRKSHYATILTWNRRDNKTGGKLHDNAFFKPQPASEKPHYIDGDAKATTEETGTNL